MTQSDHKIPQPRCLAATAAPRLGTARLGSGLVPVALTLSACTQPTADMNNIYYQWDGRTVLCAANTDDVIGVDHANIAAGLDRAVANREAVQYFAHTPGATINRDDLEFTFAAAAERGLPFLTYRELLDDPTPRAALVFSFDDSAIDAWSATRDMFARYHAHVTFFVSRFDHFNAAARAQLQQLAADGHAIEAHSVQHLRAPRYVETYGLQAYLDDEALPSINQLREAGFDTQLFAYPFGAHTHELDDALLQHVRAVRSLSFVRTSPVTADPCRR